MNEDELKNINGGAVGDGAEAIGIMAGSGSIVLLGGNL
ncbi:bacteriocin [Tenacibaculum maritimum]|nr:bacteriocin [Tenacibaculum maritimum]MCD9562609.1 bacteriocin [Tenacibaculum maritimum]MCD9566037.1 bacteriocin [Tenacibaculum maritimum]MCD9577780.1 bacteriocin [Tenacibaculum maritimum]MCD9581455.1 bacteriocin [Tenacibaculum maritimum]MCD9584937.1 bacteriocin [Tenacibaculum maritimum]